MALRCSGDSLKLAPLGLHRTAVQRRNQVGVKFAHLLNHYQSCGSCGDPEQISIT